MKKFMNDPFDVTTECLEGMCMVYKDMIVKDKTCNVVYRKEACPQNKVCIITGGGSGHEPAFAGFVGKGMADAAVVGDIFTSPSVDMAETAVRTIGSGAGTVFIYGNYQGDILNFTMAQELCRMDGLTVDTVLVWDDIASAAPDNKEERRGTAADLLVIKIAGAAADRGMKFEDVLSATIHARDNSRSIGIALSSCSLPVVGKPIFELAEKNMMLGMGIHGEPGLKEIPMMTAEGSANLMMDHLMGDDLSLVPGDEVVALVNGYGSTTLMEQNIVMKHVIQYLDDKKIHVHASLAGDYCTSLEMAGCSVTLMKLDDQLKSLFDDDAVSPGFTRVK